MTIDEREIILGQIYFALGSGAGSIRVEREAIGAIRDVLWDRIAEWSLLWDQEAAQVLERARAMGRLAAQTATARGAIAISEGEIRTAARQVATTSFTVLCGFLRELELK